MTEKQATELAAVAFMGAGIVVRTDQLVLESFRGGWRVSIRAEGLDRSIGGIDVAVRASDGATRSFSVGSRNSSVAAFLREG